MLQFINDNLFRFTTTHVTTEHGTYVKTLIKSTDEVVDIKHEVKAREEGKEFYPDRIFASVNSDTEDYNKENISALVSSDTGAHKCVIRSSAKNKYDSEIYCVAIPFNGIMTPIESTEDYKILKGMLVASDKYSINHNNRKYKKVLYLMLDVNKRNLFGNEETGEEGKEIVIKFESHYSMYKKENGRIVNLPDKWNKEVTTITINSEETYVDSERISDVEFDRDEIADKPIYKVYVKPERKKYDNNAPKRFKREASYNKRFK